MDPFNKPRLIHRSFCTSTSWFSYSVKFKSFLRISSIIETRSAPTYGEKPKPRSPSGRLQSGKNFSHRVGLSIRACQGQSKVLVYLSFSVTKLIVRRHNRRLNLPTWPPLPDSETKLSSMLTETLIHSNVSIQSFNQSIQFKAAMYRLTATFWNDKQSYSSKPSYKMTLNIQFPALPVTPKTKMPTLSTSTHFPPYHTQNVTSELTPDKYRIWILYLTSVAHCNLCLYLSHPHMFRLKGNLKCDSTFFPKPKLDKKLH